MVLLLNYCLVIMTNRFPQTQVGRKCFLLSLVAMKLAMENLLQTCRFLCLFSRKDFTLENKYSALRLAPLGSHLTGAESNIFRFLEAARRLGSDPSSCLVIEDSP